MDTRDVQSDAGISTRSMDEHSDVLHPPQSTEALNTTSTDDEVVENLVRNAVWTMSDNLNIHPFSLDPYVQRASDKSETNDETAAAPLLRLPLIAVPQPRTMDTPKEYFSIILELSRAIKMIPSTVNTLSTDFLLPVLNKLGMSDEIGEERLTQMFHISGYFDTKYARLDLEHFILFDSDFKFLEAFKAYIASSKNPGGALDVGRLGKFFQTLEAGRESGFQSSDFVNAFRALGTNLTNADANSLEQYSKLDRAESQDFDRFLKKRRSPQDDLEGRAVYLNRGQRVHRMMLFVSMYPRPQRNMPSSSHAESGK